MKILDIVLEFIKFSSCELPIKFYVTDKGLPCEIVGMKEQNGALIIELLTSYKTTSSMEVKVPEDL